MYRTACSISPLASPYRLPALPPSSENHVRAVVNDARMMEIAKEIMHLQSSALRHLELVAVVGCILETGGETWLWL
jgi:hypothetical protein